MATKLNVNGEYIQLEGQGGGSSLIDASIFFASRPESNYENMLQIKCKAGQIQEGDMPVLYRNVNQKTGKVHSSENRYRYHGWVKPRKNLDLTLQFIRTKDGYDYWEVYPTEYNTFKQYLQWRAQQPGGMERTQLPMGLVGKKCGVVLFRGEEKITDYLKFSMVNNEERGYMFRRW